MKAAPPPIECLLHSNLMAFLQRVFATLEPGSRFRSNWHHEHLAWQLTRVQRGELRRLIINQPPRSGKSMLGSVAWPMFLLGRFPEKKLICVSHTSDLARKFNIDRRRIAQCEWYRRLFPNMRLEAARDMELVTTRGGSCYAAGVEGAVLGRGADVILVDDPLKGLESLSKAARQRVNEFYDNTLVTRLNNRRQGAIVIIAQRLHEDDLVGHVTARDAWTVVSLPAIATEEAVFQLSDDPNDIFRRRVGDVLHPARENHEDLESLRRTQGSLLFQAQYQQSPAPADGLVIRSQWLRRYKTIPEHFERLVISWDLASTLSADADYSVATVWGANALDYYLIDVRRGRWETPELRRLVIELAKYYQANAVLVEDTELGRAIVQDLRCSGNLRPILRRPRFDKEARLLAQAPRFESGQVHLPEDAAWLASYVSELLAFPNGRHDDQVDSTSQALHWLTGRNAVSQPLYRRDLERRDVRRRDVEDHR